MNHPKTLTIQDYTYHLPTERIALHPLPERDASKLLIYKKGKIIENTFKHLVNYLPAESFLIFNNTKVIKARIRFQKTGGSVIEIFCLEPYEDISEYSSVMNKKGSVKWKCMIGGISKWKEGELQLKTKLVDLRIILKEKLADTYVVEFFWQPADLSFAEILELAGDIPLPPYIKRKTEAEDATRYQTVYAQHDGSVAAPTAGLHFTDAIFNSLSEKKIHPGFVTLHVGAGTFKPVKAITMQDHEMHAEWINVDIETIKNLIQKINNSIVAVGTTTLRTLESIYWMGVKANMQPAIKQLNIDQWEVYEEPLCKSNIPPSVAFTSLLKWMTKNNQQNLFSQSQIIIAPGYSFKVVNALVTNFHQPRSTLLLLVAAAAGHALPEGHAGWKQIYDHALQHEFRFLSYGDSSLIFIDQ